MFWKTLDLCPDLWLNVLMNTMSDQDLYDLGYSDARNGTVSVEWDGDSVYDAGFDDGSYDLAREYQITH